MQRLLLNLYRSALLAAVLGLISFIVIIVHLESNLPSIETLKDVELQVPLRIFSDDGKLMAEYGDKRRNPIRLEDVPPALIYAIIATEDRRFFQHPGVDIRGIARAAVALLTRGTKEQGGSTITMQVARNFFLTRHKTYSRKINEILLALKIEQELTKNEILELYVNKIYLGKRAYGVAAAANVYYGTSIDKLTLPQLAMIAGLPQAPSAINPLNSPENALKRRTHVLERMLSYGLITQEEFDEANTTPLTAKYHSRKIELHAPYVAEMARQHIIEKYGESAYDKGYEVYTTIDSKLQVNANQAVRQAILDYDKRHGYRGAVTRFTFENKKTAEEQLSIWLSKLQDIPKANGLLPAVTAKLDGDNASLMLQDGNYVTLTTSKAAWTKISSINNLLKIGDVVYVEKLTDDTVALSQLPEVEGSLVAINPMTGAVLSLVGGFDFEQSRFNRAIQAERQPGSCFKPFIYAAALEHDFTPASIINDAPIVEENNYAETDWRPQNHTKSFYGPTRLRVGITQSRNLVSIRLLKTLGIEKAVDIIDKIGIDSKSLPKTLSLALGTNLLTPLQLATAYSVFPNGGSKVESFYISKVKNYNDEIIFERHEPVLHQVLSPQTSYLITSMLQDVIQYGTGKRAKKLGRRDLAGKTGTTNDQLDAWYTGFNRDLVVTTWIGFDEPKTLKEYAVKAALPMWMDYMEKSLKGKPENSPPQPTGLTTVKIDPETGLLARANQADAVYEIFKSDMVPTKVAPEKPRDLTSIEDEDLLEVEQVF